MQRNLGAGDCIGCCSIALAGQKLQNYARVVRFGREIISVEFLDQVALSEEFLTARYTMLSAPRSEAVVGHHQELF